jgi:hypothetical protein
MGHPGDRVALFLVKEMWKFILRRRNIRRF